MAQINELFQAGDWQKEKHVPAIEAPDLFTKGGFSKISVSVGKEIPHPNVVEHHIRWITVYFLPEAEKFPYEIGRFEFSAHGESAKGLNTGSVFTHPEAAFSFKTDQPGSILAVAYCNIHGLWQNSKEIKIE